MWRGGVPALALPGLVLSLFSTAFATWGDPPAGWAFASNDDLGGSICDPTLTVFDCNFNGTDDNSNCSGISTIDACAAICEQDIRCRWMTFGWDTSNGGYWRCATFYGCPSKGLYADGDPWLYYKDPKTGSTTYDLVYNDTWCGNSVIFDCYRSGGANELLDTYNSCHPQFYDLSNCQAECDSRADCTHMLWGYETDDGGSDYFRCTLFSSCTPGTYNNKFVQVWSKPVETTTLAPDNPVYDTFKTDVICDAEHALWSCLDLDVVSDQTDCLPYRQRSKCEEVCDSQPDCRYIVHGLDTTSGYWRCNTYTSCEQSYTYNDGDPNAYVRPTDYSLISENAFCSGTALFDCVNDGSCGDYSVLADCEAKCDNDPSCSHMSWGKDFGPPSSWRCATFDDANCQTRSAYGNGLVSSWERVITTTAPTDEPTAAPTPTPAPTTATPTEAPTASPTDTPAPTQAPTSAPTTAEPYCLRITTGSRTGSDGGLEVSVDTGSGLATETLGSTSVLGDVVLEKCYASAVSHLDATNPTNDAWIGSFEYSVDGGATYRPMICDTCTVLGDSLTEVLVDGNGADGATAAGAQCLNGDSCRVVPRAQHCVKIVTGSDTGSDGSLGVDIHDTALAWSNGDGSYALSEWVAEKCYDDPVSNVEVDNPTDDSWAGTIQYSDDYGVTYEPMSCDGCTTVGDTDPILVDQNSDDVALAPTQCIKASGTCLIAPKTPAPTSAPTETPAPTEAPTAVPTAAPTATPTEPPANYCVRITTGSDADDGGGLQVSVDTGSGLAQETLSDTTVLGSTALEKCYTSPVASMTASNPTNDPWIGAVEYSSDGGTSYASMICNGCTVLGDTTTEVLVGAMNGNNDPAADGVGQCLNGDSCSLVPRAEFCVKIVTGMAEGNNGTLQVDIQDGSQQTLWSNNGEYYDLGEWVAEECFAEPVGDVVLSNPSEDAWTGSVIYSSNFGGVYQPLICETCLTLGDTSAIAVDPTGDDVGEASASCIHTMMPGCSLSLPETTTPPETNYCIRITTGSETEDGGGLTVSVNTGGATNAETLPDTTVLGATLLDKCYVNPVERLDVDNPTNNAWIGKFEYSEDGGSTYRPMICDTCTVIGDSLERLLVDGNADETALASDGAGGLDAQCLSGSTCGVVPRAQYCVKIVTGSNTGNDGTLNVEIKSGSSSTWSSTDGESYNRGEWVGERCFDEPITEVSVGNPTSDSWTGTILYSLDYGVTYDNFVCSDCADGADTTAIVVDSDNDDVGQAATQCISTGTCLLMPKAMVTTLAPEDYVPVDSITGAKKCLSMVCYDCNPSELQSGGECHQFTNIEHCQAICDKDAMCQFFLWNWDDYGYYRCITYPICDETTLYTLGGNPQIYRKVDYDPTMTDAAPRPTAAWVRTIVSLGPLVALLTALH